MAFCMLLKCKEKEQKVIYKKEAKKRSEKEKRKIAIIFPKEVDKKKKDIIGRSGENGRGGGKLPF